jgi:hypothetical protein
MKQMLKMGVTVLVVSALTMSGIALAQTDESTDQAPAANAVTRIVDKLQGLVDAGTITSDQAQAVAETLADGFEGGPRGHRRPGVGQVAEFLDMTLEEFRAALQEYDTLADLAAANGSSGDEVVAFLVAQAEEHLAQGVADGKIEQADADEKLAEFTDKITEMVNSPIPERPQGQDGRPGRHGPGGFDDQAPAAGADASA